MTGCTPAMIADPSLGACKRMRPGCAELGPWLPAYQGYVCGACLAADRACVQAGHLPADWPGARGGGTKAGCACAEAGPVP